MAKTRWYGGTIYKRSDRIYIGGEYLGTRQMELMATR